MLTQDIKEMIIHVPFCTHPKVQKVLLIDIEKDLEEEIAKHNNVDIEYAKMKEYSPKKYKFDIIIAENIDTFNEIEIAKINASLHEDGIFVGKNLHWGDDIVKTKTQMQKFEKFSIVMPYIYGYAPDTKEIGAILFCSRKYHPTADIILQKADLLDGLEYYNSDIHKACFALPTKTKNSLKEAMKI